MSRNSSVRSSLNSGKSREHEIQIDRAVSISNLGNAEGRMLTQMPRCRYPNPTFLLRLMASPRNRTAFWSPTDA